MRRKVYANVTGNFRGKATLIVDQNNEIVDIIDINDIEETDEIEIKNIITEID
jgi:hypothetical protein